MQIKFFCPRWGSESISWDEFFSRVRDEGYDGVEVGIARDTDQRDLDAIWKKADENGLVLIAQHYDTTEADFPRHKETYGRWLRQVKDYPVAKINSQTGRDIFSFDENRELIATASEFSAATGIEIVHETHRHKWSFAAHIAKEFLEKIPAFQITLDASHWVCVAESFLEDQVPAMELAIKRTGHIHARVGFPEGPQISDPRVPEWQPALQHHLRWWDSVVARRQEEDGDPVTITPEFGPYPYMPALPFTRQPVTSQWEVNAWMMRMLRERYNKIQ